MLRHLLILLLLCAAWPADAEKPLAPPVITGTVLLDAEQVAALLQGNPAVVIIDARLSEEYSKGHIPGAHNLLDTDMTEASLSRFAPNRDMPLLFYCNGVHCTRSSNAATRALSWGYRNIYWFRGGWQEWQRKELPMAR